MGDQDDDSGHRPRRAAPFGYPVVRSPTERTPRIVERVRAEGVIPRGQFTREDTGVIRDPLMRLLARTKRTAEITEDTHEILYALIEELAIESQRKHAEKKDEMDRAERDLEARRKMRQTLIVSILGVIVPTLMALAALIAALHGNSPAAAPSSPPATTETR